MKGQIISLDIMIAVLIVIVLVSGFGILLYQYTAYDLQQMKLRELEIKSEPALNVLMSTKGNPEDWEMQSCSGISALGFMEEASILSAQKLKAFVDLDYNCAKTLLGLSGLNFYFEARDNNGDILLVDGTAIQGGFEPSAGSDAIFANRQALISNAGNNYMGTITLGVWYE